LIVATAGHVDHGKTSLIKQLTGVDTDRTAEEQRRGLSINLGFAYLPVDDEHRIGFVDVPGHQRFINTMIAGISGVDVVMLVVAADDGPMPQTLEHLDILRLLGVGEYLLVISKIDRVDAQRLAAVRQQVLALLPENTPVFPVASTSGQGIPELLACLQDMARNVPVRSAHGCFRMSLDRAFHLKGAGLVVTGTVAAGTVREGDELILQPRQQRVRVRRIHAQDEQSPQARVGQRCALNLTGDVDKDDIARGDWLTTRDAIATSNRFDARLQMLANSPVALKHLAPVKLYLGAKRIDARLFLIERDTDASRLLPAETALVQLIVDGPVLCCRGDRFLLRDYGENLTLAGGLVLDSLAPQFGKARQSRLQRLAAMEQATPAQALLQIVESQQLLEFNSFAASWNLTPSEAKALLEAAELKEIERLQVSDRVLLLSGELKQNYKLGLVDFIRSWHADHPAEAGVAAAIVAQQMAAKVSPELVQPLLLELLKEGALKLASGLLSSPHHRPEFSAEIQQDWQRVERVLRELDRQVPKVSALAQQLDLPVKQLQGLLSEAVKQGRAHRLNETRYLLTPTLREFATAALKLVSEQATFSAREFRDVAGCGRNLAIEILEYFDSKQFTRRQGEVRAVINPELPQRLFNE
jgi:selenocysteine-specific elongation factor